MKIKNKVLTVLITLLLIIPFNIKAEGKSDNQVIINFFHGDGCGYCAAAQEFFDSIEEEYGSKYKLVKYEVWSNEKNQELMSAVANYLEADAGGVPFIIIGDKVFNGYTESYNSEIIAKIKSEYAKPQADRINITDKVNIVGEADDLTTKTEKESDGTVASIIFLVIVVGFAGLIVFARQKSTTVKVKEVTAPKIIKIEKEETKEEVKKDDKKKTENKTKIQKQKTNNKKKKQ